MRLDVGARDGGGWRGEGVSAGYRRNSDRPGGGEKKERIQYSTSNMPARSRPSAWGDGSRCSECVQGCTMSGPTGQARPRGI
jgi:hypothetical protein